ncbi:MAG: MG2 domain-containing protein [Gemmataceae bacterium]
MTTVRRSLVAGSALAALLATGFAWNALTAQPPNRADLWKKVREAQNKGLPQTAIKELEPVIASAVADKAYPEAVKAVALRIALEGAVQGNKPEERVTRMAAEIAKAPAPMKPAMEAILAHWYWHYFQQNRWRFLQRTATAAAPGADLTTWDLPRILAEIDKHFTAALAAEKELKAIPAADWGELFEKGTLPDKYRPTAYDLLAFEALAFYTAPEQAGAKGEDDFELAADGPALGSAEDFLAWNPPADAASRTRRAVTLFQEVLRFHLPDPDRTAFLDADLHRLRFAHAAAVGEGKAARYKAALTSFADRFVTHELSAVARVWLAQVLQGEGDYLAAKAAAKAAVDAFPNSYGGKLAANLIRQIEAPELSLVTERVWADAKPVVRVQYRNLTAVHLRLYRADWVARLGPNQYPEGNHDLKPMLAGKPDAVVTATLPATPDHKPRTQDVAIDRPRPGFYFAFASPDAGFDQAAGPIAVAAVWVSDLAIVTRNTDGATRLDGQVTTARTGEPVAGASVRTWFRDDRGQWGVGPTGVTDANGLYTLPVQQGRGWRVLVEHGGQQLVTQSDAYLHGGENRALGSLLTTVLFTDRSLYRPGQPIRFKGICLSADHNSDRYEVLSDYPTRIAFMDVNHKLITEQAVRTNGYGSFSGTFTAPRDRLTGRMVIVAAGEAPGAVPVTVEEYKRPQFLVTLDAPADPAKLGGPVTLSGKATAYTGAAVGGAKVRYRVVREVRYPPWFGEYYWWRMPTPQPAQQVASGAGTTEADGSFRITFPAVADKGIPEKDEPVFRFTVTADVTDTTGETRSADRSVQVGYSALQAEVTADEWQVVGQPVKLTVSTKSHDGEPRPATGTVTVFKLIQPDTVRRPDLLGHDRPIPLPRRGGRPGQPTPDASNPKTWEPGEAVAKLPFTTDASGTVTLAAPLPAGAYRAVLETADRFGKAVSGRRQLTVIDPAAVAFPIRQPHFLAAPKWSCEPGETLFAVWGTGYPAGRAFVEVEHRGKLLQAYWSAPGLTQVQIKQPVTEAMRRVHRAGHVRPREPGLPGEPAGRRALGQTSSSRSKWGSSHQAGAGKKETWTAVVSGPDAKQAAAEMVAAACNRSLDAFLPHPAGPVSTSSVGTTPASGSGSRTAFGGSEPSPATGRHDTSGSTHRRTAPCRRTSRPTCGTTSGGIDSPGGRER